MEEKNNEESKETPEQKSEENKEEVAEEKKEDVKEENKEVKEEEKTEEKKDETTETEKKDQSEKEEAVDETQAEHRAFVKAGEEEANAAEKIGDHEEGVEQPEVVQSLHHLLELHGDVHIDVLPKTVQDIKRNRNCRPGRSRAGRAESWVEGANCSP